MLSDRITTTVPNGSTAALTLNHTLGVTPQLVIVRTIGPATGASTGDIRLGIGWSDGTRHWAYGEERGDNNVNANSRSGYTETSVLLELDEAGAAISGRLAFTSWSSTQVVLTPSDAFRLDAFVEVIVLAALGNVYVDNFELPAATGNFTRTANNFQPDAFIVAYPRNAGTVDTAVQRSALSLGFGSTTAQWCVHVRRENGTTNYTAGGIRTGRLGVSNVNLTSWNDELSFVSVQADGYTHARSTNDAARRVSVVCIKGGLPVCGTVAAPTSTGTQSLTTTGHLGKFLAVAGRPSATADMGAPLEPAELSLGFAIGAGANESGADFLLDYNNETLNPNTTDPLAQQTETCIYRSFTRSGTDTLVESQRANVDSVQADSWTLDWSAVSATATLVGFFSLGNAPNANNGAYYRMMMEAASR